MTASTVRPLRGTDAVTDAAGRVGWVLVAIAVLSVSWAVLTSRVLGEG